ncbi:hypothetical protein GCM10009836_04200 [Pseudonocardia ailaonensis]|uniref:Uncharacterized protein n=1 Tax=Pseudonocardia ailaonensis TaxID=367279 RepID=A0ABN2MKW3_9PSEU
MVAGAGDLPGERAQEHVERLGQPGPPRVEGLPEGLVVHDRPAAPDAQVEAAAGDLVEQGGLLGDRARRVHRQDRDGGADAHPRGLAEQVRGERERGRVDAVGDEVVLGRPQIVQAQRLGAGGEIQRGAEHLTVGLVGEAMGE